MMIRLGTKNRNITICCREAAKISALLSGKIDKYKYIAGAEILPSNQRQIIEQAKFAYSPLGKLFKNKQNNRLVL